MALRSGGRVVRWASKKAGGSTKNTKNKTRGKRLGLKCGDGEFSDVSREERHPGYFGQTGVYALLIMTNCVTFEHHVVTTCDLAID